MSSPNLHSPSNFLTQCGKKITIKHNITCVYQNISRSSYHSLGDLSPGSYNWNIKVRIIRTWRGVSRQGEGFKGLNLLLLDDKVSKFPKF